MSETPESLIKRVHFTLRGANVIPVPIDPTLSHEGESADAKATGDAIAGVLANLLVNGKGVINNLITLLASDIKMSSEVDAPTIVEAIETASDRDASAVMYDTTNLVTVKDALDSINTALESDLTEEEIDDILEEVFGGDE